MKQRLRPAALMFLLLAASGSPAQWVVQHTPSLAQTISALRFYDANTGYHTSSLFNGSTLNIYKTTNGGMNYTAQNSGYTSQRFMSIWIIHPDTVFISGNYGKILRTYNGGGNWITVNSDTMIQYWGLQFVNSSTGFAAGSFGKIIRTVNKGDNWTTLNTGVTSALDGLCFLDDNTGYAGGSNVIMKTTNSGETWTLQQGIFSSFETATAIVFRDQNTGYYATNAGRIVKTTNGGGNWSEVYFNSGVAVWGLSFTDDNTGFGCRSDGTVLRTTDAGNSWGVQNTPLSENLYEMDFPDSQTGYIGAWSGKVLKTTNGGLTFIGGSESLTPGRLSIWQIFPNPFNPETRISYMLAEKHALRISVHDVLGREVAVLFDGVAGEGPGEVLWNSGELSAGIYFVRFSDGITVSVRRALLLK
ncbi:MAG: T9SS type A sorting domain-containing protein [Ignavibacteria bacterium]|nr:T9SS type A sorting domain-containing protein [Ignavibacteria bacterium]